MSPPSRFPNDTSDKWFFLALGVIGVILLLMAGYQIVIRYAESKTSAGFSAEQIGNFDRWYSQKLSIPPDTLKIEPFTSQTLEAVHAFDRMWAQSGTAARELLDARKAMRESQNTGGSTESLQVTASVLEWRHRLAPLEPLMDAWREVVKCPDYRIQVWFLPRMASSTDSPIQADMASLGQAGQVGRLVHLDALIHWEEGRFEEALDDADALLTYAHTPLDCTGVERIFVSGGLTNGLEIYEHLVPCLKSPDQKKRILRDLEKHRDQGLFRTESELDPVTEEDIAETWRARYRGLVPDFQNKTGPEITEESFRVRLDYARRFILPRAESPTERAKIERSVQFMEQERLRAQGHMAKWKQPLLRRIHRSNMMLYYRMVGDFEKIQKNEAEVRQQYERLMKSLRGEGD